ncbi:hypothetical protein K461DRAFT_96515 [Myriangium duriaei CBS 260.36]|uniref:Uncharacterized protein n=1 Tax=Myriangium duriaei CBS 260.36 TaxID=1168546 RepID=A0A9P4MKN2_9PEZI|nr:hypothetical protein K461DRAFT_96515 [Myriangium duriaei CBS 260.36]
MTDGPEEIPRPVLVQPLSFHVAPSEVGRQLPAREVTRASISGAYVQFILFCNPAIGQTSDTVALVETFSSPPTSNKKVFHVYDIFLQVKRLYELDTKTWIQLALDLGIEPATADEGAGASQRIHQYIVRLKRWLKLTHVDPFFHYLVGKPHDYYLKIPSLTDPHPADGRDGVLMGDDLALRALNPDLRPKRGRKRLQSAMEDLPVEQQHSLPKVAPEHHLPLTATPLSAFPRSAVDNHAREPWSSVSARFPTSIGTPAAEPRSAFSTFHASPHKEFNRPSKLPQNPPPDADWLSQSQQAAARNPMAPSLPDQSPIAPMSAVSASSHTSRPSKQRLQLQVPDHVGGPVRLMTPVATARNDTGMASRQPSNSNVALEANDTQGTTVDWRQRCLQLEMENKELRLRLERARIQMIEIAATLSG